MSSQMVASVAKQAQSRTVSELVIWDLRSFESSGSMSLEVGLAVKYHPCRLLMRHLGVALPGHCQYLRLVGWREVDYLSIRYDGNH